MPQKMMKATASQNSALCNMSTSRSGLDLVESGLDLLRGRGLAGQALDDGGSGVAGDGIHMAHGVCLLGRDGRLGFGQTLVEIGLVRVARRVALGRQLGAGFLRESLCAALGLGEGLLV